MATILPALEHHGPEDTPRVLGQAQERADTIFRAVTRAGGFVVVTVMLLVGAFLLKSGWEAIGSVGLWDFLTTRTWSPETGNFGVAALICGTVLIATVALVVAFPLSIATALFITEVAPGWLKRVLTSAIDLMAALPSVVIGLWGLAWLQVNVVDFSRWVSTWFGWIPVFDVPGADPANPLPLTANYTSSTFIAGLVVGVMVVPIMTSMMVESFGRAPIGEREGAYALGATRWGMIRAVVLPFGKGGIIGGTMLGLGRALGETIAVYLIISPVFTMQYHILARGANSVSAHIALRYGESSGLALSALMAAGLVLFVLTMVINFTASAVIARSRSGAESEA